MDDFLKYIPEEDRLIYLKWQKMGLLSTDGNFLSNLFLAKLCEKFTIFLIEMETPKWWEECDFTGLFIPLAKKLYIEGLTDNHELIYDKFKEWYEIDGHKYKTYEEYITNFVAYFRKFKKNGVSDVIKRYTILTNETGGIAKPEYKKHVLITNLKFEECSEIETDLIISELSDLLIINNLNICYFPIYKLNNETYSIRDTNDDINVIREHLDNGEILSIFSAKFNDENTKIVYRYNVNNQ